MPSTIPALTPAKPRDYVIEFTVPQLPIHAGLEPLVFLLTPWHICFPDGSPVVEFSQMKLPVSPVINLELLDLLADLLLSTDEPLPDAERPAGDDDADEYPYGPVNQIELLRLPPRNFFIDKFPISSPSL